MDRADLVAVHAADQSDALAGVHAFHHDDGNVPVLPRHSLHAFKVEVVPAGFEIVNVEGADNLLSLDGIPRIDRASFGRGPRCVRRFLRL
ncbi:hypothetical protein D3C87_1783900 [compost metagenome]